ncbi:MAG: DUF5916 domain-containing protein [Gammaproteobacteria bacterium]
MTIRKAVSWLAGPIALTAFVTTFATLSLPTRASAQQTLRRYTIQAVARSTAAQAEAKAEEIEQALGPRADVRVEHHAPYYTVRVGYFLTATDARQILSRIWNMGYEDAWIARTLVSAQSAKRTEAGLIADPSRPSTGEGKQFGQVAAEEKPPVQEEAAKASPSGRKRIRAMPFQGKAPTIDGRLDDPVWQTARFVSDFQQRGPTRGWPTRELTEIAFLYDQEALYVGSRMHVKVRKLLRAQRSSRDDPAHSDRIVVSLDTYRNRQTAYSFGVTVGGTRLDYYQPEDVFAVRDPNYDPVWDAETAIDTTGWTAEMRIPFSQLQFHPADSMLWGVNIQRMNPAQRLNVFWVVVPGNETGWASRFGDLVGITGVRPSRRFAIVPYVTGQGVFSDFEPSPDDPFAREDGEMHWRYGGDLQLDLTPSLSFEATFNPDFGQIEADPAVVNLTAYETFFPERRPFFLEGAALFEGQGPRYFYSRRIGAPPHGDVNAQFREEPVGTTILGAAKLIGRTPGGVSVGALAALSDQERARTFDLETGTFDGVPVEPQTFFGVSRIQKDFGAGSTFGVVGTAVRRRVSDGEALAALLPEQAYAGGMDWNLRFAGQSHEFGGFAGASMVEGDSIAIRRLQRSSARYYQRPDADYVDLDPTRTILAGYAGGFHLSRISGTLRWRLSGQVRSPGFEINDAGAMPTADDIVTFGELRYGLPMRVGPWRRIDLSGSVSSGWNYGGVRQFMIPAVHLGFIWDNFWQTYARAEYDTRALSDNLTRGGPLMGTGEAMRVQYGVSSNNADRNQWSIDAYYSSDEFGGWSYSVTPGLTLRPNQHFELSLGPGYERAQDARQFYGSLPDGRPESFGRRYLFASLSRSTLYARVRAGIAITPDVGFEFYAEPFAASGHYFNFGELAAARSRDLRIYGIAEGTSIVADPENLSYEVTDGDQTFTLGDGDFDVWSYRSNAVFRWDYAQGSTFYLVWQQNRLAQDFLGEQVGPENLLDALTAPGEDILAVKLTFRLGFD